MNDRCASQANSPLTVTRMMDTDLPVFTPVRPSAQFFVIDPAGVIYGPECSIDEAKAIIAKRRLNDDAQEWHLVESGALHDAMEYIDAQIKERECRLLAVSRKEVH